MQTKDAISRLSYTISKGNKPNDNDKVALNAVISFINKSDTEAVQSHLCFAKLYAFVLNNFLHNHQDINVANKMINKELSLPFDHHAKMLQMNLKNIELGNFFNSKNVTDNAILNRSGIDRIEKAAEYKKVFPELTIKEMQEAYEMWDYDNVMAHLKRNINESLTAYKNV